MKNITLSLSKELADMMEELPEVNWSQVARNCIKNYIKQRRNPDIAPLLEKFRKERSEEYMKGRRKAEDIAKMLGYSKLNILLKSYWKKHHRHETDWMYPSPPGEYIPTPNDLMEEVLVSNHLIKKASDEYIKGLRERLLEIEKSL